MLRSAFRVFFEVIKEITVDWQKLLLSSFTRKPENLIWLVKSIVFVTHIGEVLNKSTLKPRCQIQHNDAIGCDVGLVAWHLTSDLDPRPAMMNIDVLHAQIVRSNTTLPWGLHLHGGGGQPLIIAQASFNNSTFQFWLSFVCVLSFNHVDGWHSYIYGDISLCSTDRCR